MKRYAKNQYLFLIGLFHLILTLYTYYYTIQYITRKNCSESFIVNVNKMLDMKVPLNYLKTEVV